MLLQHCIGSCKESKLTYKRSMPSEILGRISLSRTSKFNPRTDLDFGGNSNPGVNSISYSGTNANSRLDSDSGINSGIGVCSGIGIDFRFGIGCRIDATMPNMESKSGRSDSEL